MTVGGGRVVDGAAIPANRPARPRLSKAQLDAGRAKGLAKRLALREAGMKAARAWRAEHHPVSASGHMPFAGHRTQGEVRAADEQRAQADV